MRLLDVNHLYNTILSCVDMKIRNTIVCSQSTNGEIYFNERMLKYNPNGFTLVHNGEIKFDPINNFKQAQQLFSIFLQFEEQDEGLYTQMFYDEKNSEDKTRIFMRTNLGNFVSQYYYNISLGYLELILVMSGIMVDNLLEFDSAPPVEEEQKRRKRTLFPLRDLF
jgi:hypothetical protein